MEYQIELHSLSVRFVHSKLLQQQERQWQEKVNFNNAKKRSDYSKLRTCRTFKNHYSTEPYVKIITAKRIRSAYIQCLSAC